MLYLIVLDHDWPRMTGTPGREASYKGNNYLRLGVARPRGGIGVFSRGKNLSALKYEPQYCDKY